MAFFFLRHAIPKRGACLAAAMPYVLSQNHAQWCMDKHSQPSIMAFCVNARGSKNAQRAETLRTERMDRQREACQRLDLAFPLRRTILKGSGRPSREKNYKLVVEEAILNDALPDSVTSLVPPPWWQKGRPLEATVEEAEAFLQGTTRRQQRRKSTEVQIAEPAASSEDVVENVEDVAGGEGVEEVVKARREYKPVPPEVKLWFLEYVRMQRQLFKWDMVRSFILP